MSKINTKKNVIYDFTPEEQKQYFGGEQPEVIIMPDEENGEWLILERIELSAEEYAEAMQNPDYFDDLLEEKLENKEFNYD